MTPQTLAVYSRERKMKSKKTVGSHLNINLLNMKAFEALNFCKQLNKQDFQRFFYGAQRVYIVCRSSTTNCVVRLSLDWKLATRLRGKIFALVHCKGWTLREKCVYLFKYYYCSFKMCRLNTSCLLDTNCVDKILTLKLKLAEGPLMCNQHCEKGGRERSPIAVS